VIWLPWLESTLGKRKGQKILTSLGWKIKSRWQFVFHPQAMNHYFQCKWFYRSNRTLPTLNNKCKTILGLWLPFYSDEQSFVQFQNMSTIFQIFLMIYYKDVMQKMILPKDQKLIYVMIVCLYTSLMVFFHGWNLSSFLFLLSLYL